MGRRARWVAGEEAQRLIRGARASPRTPTSRRYFWHFWVDALLRDGRSVHLRVEAPEGGPQVTARTVLPPCSSVPSRGAIPGDCRPSGIFATI